MALRRDFEYWGLDELLIEPCCALKYYPALEVIWKIFSNILKYYLALEVI